MALEAGVALSEDGKARAGMGVDAADFDGSGRPGLAVTNFDNEMIGLYRPQPGGSVSPTWPTDPASASPRSRDSGFGCVFADLDLDGALDLVVANGHIDETVRNIRGNVGYAQAPLLFLNQGNGDVSRRRQPRGQRLRAAPRRPRSGLRRLRSGWRRRSADDDQQRAGRALPERPAGGNRSVRFRLIGTQSNRDAIGATVRIFHGGTSQSRVVRSGSSYLSQSELPVTFGVGKRDVIDRVTITWPNGRAEEFTKVATGQAVRLHRRQRALRELSVTAQLPTPNL